jgi:hypothetical protein
MAHFAVVVTGERLARERLYADVLVAVRDTTALPPDADVALIALDPKPVLFGLGRATPDGAVRYTHRLLDAPVPVPFDAGVGTWPLDAAAFDALADGVDAAHRVGAGRRSWLVTVSLPVEAGTAAEAVRAFWSYVRDLGPAELPAFVSPSGDELAMQAYVLGGEANQDPEED